MNLRPVLLTTLLVAACSPSTGTPTASSSSTKPASTAPSTAASTATTAATTSAAPAAGDGNFVPTKLTVSVDGAAFDIAQKGYLAGDATKTSAGYSLGAGKGEKAGARTVQWPSITVISKGKDLAAADFTQADAGTIVLGLNWVKNLTVRTYTADASGKTTLTAAGGKLNISYSGKMNRGPGSGDFPETIMVEITAEGLPTSI
jgi:hypothetical protein